MEIVGVINGVTSVRTLPEVFVPERSPPQAALIAFVASLFQFSHYPQLLPHGGTVSPLVFQGGQYDDGNGVYGIPQLVMDQSSDVIVAGNTNQTNAAIDYLFSSLKHEFGFKLDRSSGVCTHNSTAVVKFSVSIDQSLKAISIIADKLSSLAGGVEYKFSGLSFTPLAQEQNPQVWGFQSEFKVERRAGTPISENHYFSAAPLTTESHLALLQIIEETLCA